MWKDKKDLAGATSGIGINQQVDLESNKWKKVMQQVERKNATGGKVREMPDARCQMPDVSIERVICSMEILEG